MASILDSPKPPVDRPKGRVHRLGHDDDHGQDDEPPASEPAIAPFVASDAKGDLRTTGQGEYAMPRGIYPRKPRAKSADASMNAGTTPAPEKKKRRRRKARADLPAIPAAAQQGGAGSRFEITLDLRAGQFRIAASKGELTLTGDEVASLIGLFRPR